MQNGSSVGIYYTQCIHVFARLAPIGMLSRSVIINKISASELSRKFIKSALLVGRDQKAFSSEDTYLYVPTWKY